MQAQVSVLNNSSTKNVYITFKPPEDANIPEPNKQPILPGKVVDKYVSFATMNLFVWTDIDQSPIWSGVVPTKVKKTIVIDPDKKEVSYDGIVLPEGFTPVTDVSGMGFSQGGSNKNMWWLLVILLLVICLIIGFLYYRKR